MMFCRFQITLRDYGRDTDKDFECSTGMMIQKKKESEKSTNRKITIKCLDFTYPLSTISSRHRSIRSKFSRASLLSTLLLDTYDTKLDGQQALVKLNRIKNIEKIYLLLKSYTSIKG